MSLRTFSCGDGESRELVRGRCSAVQIHQYKTQNPVSFSSGKRALERAKWSGPGQKTQVCRRNRC